MWTVLENETNSGKFSLMLILNYLLLDNLVTDDMIDQFSNEALNHYKENY